MKTVFNGPGKADVFAEPGDLVAITDGKRLVTEVKVIPDSKKLAFKPNESGMFTWVIVNEDYIPQFVSDDHWVNIRSGDNLCIDFDGGVKAEPVALKAVNESSSPMVALVSLLFVFFFLGISIGYLVWG